VDNHNKINIIENIFLKVGYKKAKLTFKRLFGGGFN